MEKLENLTYSISIIFYLFSIIYGFLYHYIFRKWNLKGTYLFAFLGFISHFFSFIIRWILTGHIPTIGNYENILMGSLVIVFFILIFLKREKLLLPFLYSLSLNILLMGFGLVSDTTKRPLVASLKSFWLFIHIIFAWLAYASFTISAGIALAYLLKKEKNPLLEELSFKICAFGFVMDGLMIVAGSIWAKALWGSYWSWDPVETWSLISFLLYGLILHLKIALKLKPKVFAYLLIIALITVIISFWGVNFFMEKSLHIFNVG